MTNKCSNVNTFKLAVSSKKGDSKLYISNKLGEHSLVTKGKSFQKIESNSIDNLFKGVKIDFIKMDIEGWEAHALKGMKKTIKSNPQLKIFSEFSPNLLKQSGIDSEEYLVSLNELGFKIRWLNQNKAIKKLNNDSMDSTNILCIR